METVVSMLIEQARALSRTGMKKHLRVLPMYAGLPSPEQMKVFERVSHSVRKVRLSPVSQFLPPRRVSASHRLYISGSHHETTANTYRGRLSASPNTACQFQTVNQEHVLWLPFASLISLKHVSSNSPVYLINFSVFKSLHTALYLSVSSCSFLRSEVLYFYLFLFLFVV